MRTFGLALLVTFVCAARPHVDPPLRVAHRVLFIGNSLTSVNDLPGTVSAIARAAGDSLSVAGVVAMGLALIDHYHGATEALAAIRRGGWDYVVLQQRPTSAGGVCADTLALLSRAPGPAARPAGLDRGLRLAALRLW
jgi:hypothetical protein